MAITQNSFTPDLTGTTFSFDDGLDSNNGSKYRRGHYLNAFSSTKRQIVTTVIARRPGEVRTYSRDTGRDITFQLHIWGNPTQDEPGLQAVCDTVKANLNQGMGKLCLSADLRYWNAELVEFDAPEQQDGDVWHRQCVVTFHAPSPFAQGATTTTTRINGAMTNSSGTLYSNTWSVSSAATLGSYPSPFKLQVTVNTSNGLFLLRYQNTTASPNQVWVVTPVSGTTFGNGDVILFDGPNGIATHQPNGGSVLKAGLPAQVITVNPALLPETVGLQARASGGAPNVTAVETYTQQYA